MAETNYEQAQRYELVPGFFNIIEKGTRTNNTKVNNATGARFGDTNLTTHIAGKPFDASLILYGVNTSTTPPTINTNTLQTNHDKSVGIFLAAENDNGTMSIQQFIGERSAFDAHNGRIPLNGITINRAYKSAFFHFYYCDRPGRDWDQCWDYTPGTTPIKIDSDGGESDSYDRFAVRPDRFAIASPTLGNIKSGETFSLQVQALDYNGNETPNYNESITVDTTSAALELSIGSGCPKNTSEPLSISGTPVFSDGVADINLTYDDVGDINITLHEISGSEFAAIDNNDTDFNATVDDSPQTVNDDYREINASNVASITVIPDHFEVTTSFKNHNNGLFTYLSADLNMSATLEMNITAKNTNDTTTENYISTCASKATDINLSFAYDIDELTLKSHLDSSAPFLSQLHDRNGAYISPLVSSTDINTSAYSSVPDTVFGSSDQNGTAKIDIHLNFNRQLNQPTDPFDLNLTSIKISDANGVENNTSTTTLPDINATYLYAKAQPTLEFYDDVEANTIATPIMVQVYCSFWPDSRCQNYHIDTVNGKTNTSRWWLSTQHNTGNGDGNITLSILSPASGASVSPNVSIASGGIDNTVSVSATSTVRPLLVKIGLDTTNPGDTNSWLIYHLTTVSNPFYSVRFIGTMGWAGYGKTGHVVDENSSRRKNRRLGW
jgi:hypothetical protein